MSSIEFVCPMTHQVLHPLPVSAGEGLAKRYLAPAGARPADKDSSEFVVSEDERCAYPVRKGIPVLLGSAVWTLSKEDHVGVADHRQALADDALYGRLAASRGDDEPDDEAERLRRLAVEGGEFLDEPTRWIDNSNMMSAEVEALTHLQPIDRAACLQIGGRGQYAVAMAIGGGQAGLISPVFEELLYARRLAAECNVGPMALAVGIGEHLPLKDGSVGRIFVPHSLHHMQADLALAELDRVVEPGGAYATVDVWRSALYGAGTRLFGRAVPGADCRPMDHERLEAIEGPLLSDLELTLHGAVLRYPVAVAQRMGFVPSPGSSMRLSQIDDRLLRAVGALEALASTLVIRGCKPS